MRQVSAMQDQMREYLKQFRDEDQYKRPSATYLKDYSSKILTTANEWQQTSEITIPAVKWVRICIAMFLGDLDIALDIANDSAYRSEWRNKKVSLNSIWVEFLKRCEN